LADYNGEVKLCDLYNKNDDDSCFITKGYITYCNDCHYSRTKIEAKCINDGCITCLYIGDDADDDDPMDKCYIRSYRPFYDMDSKEGEYYAPFFREEAKFEYDQMEEFFDLRNENTEIWNVAKTS